MYNSQQTGDELSKAALWIHVQQKMNILLSLIILNTSQLYLFRNLHVNDF